MNFRRHSNSFRESYIDTLGKLYEYSTRWYAKNRMSKPPVPALLLKAMQVVKPTTILSVPLIIEKIYRNSIVPTIRKSRMLMLDGQEYELADVQSHWPETEEDFRRPFVVLRHRRREAGHLGGAFPSEGGFPVCGRLWIDGDFAVAEFHGRQEQVTRFNRYPCSQCRAEAG